MQVVRFQFMSESSLEGSILFVYEARGCYDLESTLVLIEGNELPEIYIGEFIETNFSKQPVAPDGRWASIAIC